ncbi:MAG: hypothetical protein GY781_15525 [Gammaproteobacteria bacterium]|nr:hypothetical protein [Gammaproteobacteria bacterium]
MNTGQFLQLETIVIGQRAMIIPYVYRKGPSFYSFYGVEQQENIYCL